jgi:tellurite resistance protein TerC
VLGLVWAAFVLLVLLILAFDLGVFSRESKTLSAKTALFRTGVYFVLALLFTVFVYFAYENHWFELGIYAENADANIAQDDNAHLPDSGWEAAVQFFMGYILEQSLSVDNIFVIALILGYFKVPSAYQHRVLLWGILGALIMRGVMIGAGVALIKQFEWMTYVFGAFLLFTALRMLLAKEDDEVDFNKAYLIRMLSPRLHPNFVEDHFFTKIDGRWMFTPLFLALLIVETTDLVFAVDSIPAVIGLTRDPFLVFTSNVFAILGLRSLYFALADLMGRFHLLKYSLVIILALVGAKMMLEKHLIPHGEESEGMVNIISFAVIAVTLFGGVVASFIYPEKEEAHSEKESQPDSETATQVSTK